MMVAMTPWVQRLLIANVVMFFVTATSPGLARDLAFYPPAAIIRPWTVVTYMFLHGGLWHLAGNMIGLFFFGPRLEERLGGKGFLGTYFVAGIGGAVLQAIFAPGAPMVGASGGVYGVLVGFAMFWPHERILIFPFPVPIQARVLIIAYIVISIYQGAFSLNQGVAHFAHLGGAACAFLFIKWLDWRRGAAKRDFQKKLRNDASPGGVVGDRIAVARWKGITVDSLHELNREEVERLLAKIGASGPSSLTASEREFLDRMAKR